MRAIAVLGGILVSIFVTFPGYAQDVPPAEPAPPGTPAASGAGAPPPAAPTPATSVSLARPKVHFCIPKNKITTETTLRPPNEVVSDCAGRELKEDPDLSLDPPRVRSDEHVLVYAGDGGTTLRQAHIKKVSYTFSTSGASEQVCVDLSSSPASYDPFFARCIVKTPDDAFHLAPLAVKVEFDNLETSVRWAVLTRPVSLAGKAYGFWVPVGLFGTDFHSNSDGIALAALPVGLAWGVQANINGGDYIGLSGISSWAIAPQKRTDGTTGDYFLSAYSVGAIIDFDSFIYVGYAYAGDFRSGYKDPGHMAVLGVGPKMLKFFKAQ